MIGICSALNQQRSQAQAYRAMCQAAMAAQEDAADRALVQTPYIGRLVQPEIMRHGGQWFAIIEAGRSVPKVNEAAE